MNPRIAALRLQCAALGERAAAHVRAQPDATHYPSYAVLLAAATYAFVHLPGSTTLELRYEPPALMMLGGAAVIGASMLAAALALLGIGCRDRTSRQISGLAIVIVCSSGLVG